MKSRDRSRETRPARRSVLHALLVLLAVLLCLAPADLSFSKPGAQGGGDGAVAPTPGPGDSGYAPPTAAEIEKFNNERRADLERSYGPLKSLPEDEIPVTGPESLSLTTAPPSEIGYIEVRPHLYLNPDVGNVEEALRYLAVPIGDRPRMVVSLVDPNSKDGENIRRHAGPRFQTMSASLATLEALLVQQRGGIVVLVGHSELGELVQTVSEGEGHREVGRIPILEAQQIAKANRVLLYLATCRGAEDGTNAGVINDLYTPAVLAGLDRNRDAKTYEDLYASFGSAQHPAIVQGFTQDMEHVMIEIATRVGSRVVIVTAVDGRAGWEDDVGRPETSYFEIVLLYCAALFFGFGVAVRMRAWGTPREGSVFGLLVCTALSLLFFTIATMALYERLNTWTG